MVDEREEHFKRTSELIVNLLDKNPSLFFVLKRLKKHTMLEDGGYRYHFKSTNSIANENTLEIAGSTYAFGLTLLSLNKLIKKEGKARYYLTPELFYFFENYLDEINAEKAIPTDEVFYPQKSFKFVEYKRSKKK